MQQVDSSDMERILAVPALVQLSANELRILINALNAAVYFSEVDDEEYIDDEGLALLARLEGMYLDILTSNRPSAAAAGPVA